MARQEKQLLPNFHLLTLNMSILPAGVASYPAVSPLTVPFGLWYRSSFPCRSQKSLFVIRHSVSVTRFIPCCPDFQNAFTNHGFEATFLESYIPFVKLANLCVFALPTVAPIPSSRMPSEMMVRYTFAAVLIPGNALYRIPWVAQR